MKRCMLALVVGLALTCVAGVRGKAPKAAKKKADSKATRLLADARAARAVWQNFPGFTADVVVNLDGKTTRGKLTVSAKGEVNLDGLEDRARSWSRRMLRSLVGHRLSTAAQRKTPCAFADKVAAHPIGRAIQVLNDEFHSRYRIRDRQIILVHRQMGAQEFIITVLQNHTNQEGKFLPASYVVNYWDRKTGALVRSRAHSRTWKRVGSFDLPVVARVITAWPRKDAGRSDLSPLEGNSIHLSNHKLLKATTE